MKNLPESVTNAFDLLDLRVRQRVPDVCVNVGGHVTAGIFYYGITFLASVSANTLDLCVAFPNAERRWLEADLVVGESGTILAETGMLPVEPERIEESESLASVVRFVACCEQIVVEYLVAWRAYNRLAELSFVSLQYDAQPNAVNHVVYRYLVDSGMSYLSDIFYTSPVVNPSTPGLEAYAHHVKLNYDARPDDTFSFRRGWRVGSTLRLSGIDITSKTFSGQGSRRQVRRYHLGYDPSLHASLLTSVQMEGRCHPTGPNGIGEDQEAEESGESSGFALPGGTACPTLPSLTLGYEHVEPYKTDGSVSVADLAGYEGFDERITSMHASPDHSVDEAQTDLFDINHDGLPDILVTAPGLYPSAQLGGQHGVYLNSIPDPNHLAAAAKDTLFPTTAVTAGVGVDTNILKLSHDNVVTLDLDGDAISNLLHMPLVKKYQVITHVWGRCPPSR